MSDIVNVHDLKTNYSKYLDHVLETGEEIVLGKYGKPVAKIIPLSSANKAPRKLGGLAGKIKASSDFDEPMLWLWDEIKNKQV